MCGLDLTHQFGVDDAFVARLRNLGNGFGPFCAGFLAAYLENVRGFTKLARRGGASRPVRGARVTDPELFAGARVPVVIETTGEHTRGMTLVDRRSWARGHGNVEWAEHIDAAPAFEVVTAAIAAAP